MQSPFYLLFSLKTTDGYKAYGEFELGTDRDFAYRLFDELQGNPDLDNHCHFHIDLIETVEMLPEKIRSKCCKLDELGDNVRTIARAVFRQINLEDES